MYNGQVRFGYAEETGVLAGRAVICDKVVSGSTWVLDAVPLDL